MQTTKYSWMVMNTEAFCYLIFDYKIVYFNSKKYESSKRYQNNLHFTFSEYIQFTMFIKFIFFLNGFYS